jgi:hypothetical protein
VEAVKLGRFRISLEGLGLAVLALALVLSVTRCAGIQEGKQAERLAQLERNAYKSSLANIAARRTTDSLARENIVAAQRLARQVANSRKIAAQLGAVLDANDSLLRLPPDSSDVLTLRLQLQRTTEVARLFMDSTEVLLAAVLSSLSAQEAERQAWLAERAKAAEAIALERQVSEHLRKQARCRILGASCPTRVQSGMVGGGLVLLLIALL